MADLIIELDPADSPVALHHLTLGGMKSIVKQALGKTTYDADFDIAAICNDAVALLAHLHPWNWRHKAFSVNTVADQPYVTLPADFAELVTDATGTTGIFPSMIRSSLTDIAMYRASTLAGGVAATLYAINYVPAEEADALPTVRFEMWPAPTTIFPITGTYRRVINSMASDDDVPDVPVQFHQLLRRILRAHAFEEDDQTADAARAWDAVNALLPTAQMADGRLDSNLGQMRGGIGDLGCSDGRVHGVFSGGRIHLL